MTEVSPRRGRRGRPLPPPTRARPLGEHAAALVARNAGRVRDDEYADRRAQVDELLRQRDRRRRQLLILGVVAGVVVGGSIGWVVGDLLGAVVGVLVGGNLAILPEVAAGVAARRGARAWDWQAQRHRLLGDPSRRVEPPSPRDTPGRDPRDQRR